MIRRTCRDCGFEMIKELTPEGAKFFCKECEAHTPYDEADMNPLCPECGDVLEFCVKCSQAFFCNKCNALVSSKKIKWQKT